MNTGESDVIKIRTERKRMMSTEQKKECFGKFQQGLNHRFERRCAQCVSMQKCQEKTYQNHTNPVGRKKKK